MRLPSQLDTAREQVRKAAASLLAVLVLGTTSGATLCAAADEMDGQTTSQSAGQATGQAAGQAAETPRVVPGMAPTMRSPLNIPAGLGDIKVREAGSPTNTLDQMLTPGTIQQVPTLPEIHQTPEMIERVHKLEKEGEKLFTQALIDQALIKWQEAYGLCLEMKYTEGQGRALTNMCRVFLARGQWVKAKYMGENALEVLAEARNKKDLGRARVCLAQAYYGLDNPVWAGQQLAQALKDYQELGASSALESADLTTMCANVLLKMNKIKEAIQFMQASATYLEQGGDIHSSIVKRVGISLMLIKLGLYVAALEEGERGLSLARSGGSKNPTSLPVALACVANGQYTLCEYGKALKSYEEAYHCVNKLSNQQMPDLSKANLDLGFAHTLIANGYPETAKQRLDRALTLFKKVGDSLGQAQACNALGMAEECLGQHGKAVLWFQKALDLQAVINPKQDRLQVTVLQNLAAAESRAGNNRNARVHLDAAIALFKRPKKPIKDQVLCARTLSALGEVCLRLADMQAAEENLKLALSMGGKINDDASLWRTYTLLAKVPPAGESPTPVSELLNSALSHFRSPQAGVFASPERLIFPTSREELGEELVAMLAKKGMPQQALLAAEQLKDELFIVEWNRRGGQVKPEDSDIYRDLMQQRAHFHAAEDSGPPSSLTKEWQTWMTRFKGLVQQNRQLARLIAPVPMSVEEIAQAARAKNVTILDYLIGNTSSVAFTIDGTGRLSATVLPVGRARLKQQIAALVNGSGRQAASHEESQAQERNLLATLCTELLPAGVRQLLPKNPEQMVVVVPDGPLFNLPFSALITDQGRYLIEQHTLTMAPSVGLFIDSPPRYTDDLSLVVASAGNSTSDESALISEIFQPELVTRLVGKETPVSTIQEQARGKAVIHFASRVLLQERNPLDSILPLAPAKDDRNKKVTADRLFEMSLPNDLMVWSGSSVLGKDIQGNAVKMFSRGLNYAGVRNVLMSLWSEPNAQRTEALVQFYKNKQAGLNQAQSLRKAQLVALSKNPSPRSWAAFQLLGPGF